MRRSICCAVRAGEQYGLDDRSVSCSPSRYWRAHFEAVAGEHWNRSAARRTGQPCSTMSTASRRRPSGVSGAFG